MRYDLCVANPIKQIEANSEPWPFDAGRLRFRGTIEVGLELHTARAAFERIRKLGGNVYLVPVAYRTPSIAIEQAKVIALREHARMRSSGRKLTELDEGCDDMLWWTFLADDLDAIDNDLVPGNLRIAIDKLSGQLRTEDAHRLWLQLSTDEP